MGQVREGTRPEVWSSSCRDRGGVRIPTEKRSKTLVWVDLSSEVMWVAAAPDRVHDATIASANNVGHEVSGPTLQVSGGCLHAIGELMVARFGFWEFEGCISGVDCHDLEQTPFGQT